MYARLKARGPAGGCHGRETSTSSPAAGNCKSGCGGEADPSMLRRSGKSAAAEATHAEPSMSRLGPDLLQEGNSDRSDKVFCGSSRPAASSNWSHSAKARTPTTRPFEDPAVSMLCPRQASATGARGRRWVAEGTQERTGTSSPPDGEGRGHRCRSSAGERCTGCRSHAGLISEEYAQSLGHAQYAGSFFANLHLFLAPWVCRSSVPRIGSRNAF